MVSREKAIRYLQESDSHAHYASIVEYALTYFITRAKKEGNERFAADLERVREDYHEHFRWALELTEQVYAEHFTDEELDDLIVLQSNPAMQKARALAGDIFSEVLEKYERMST